MWQPAIFCSYSLFVFVCLLAYLQLVCFFLCLLWLRVFVCFSFIFVVVVVGVVAAACFSPMAKHDCEFFLHLYRNHNVSDTGVVCIVIVFSFIFV